MAMSTDEAARRAAERNVRLREKRARRNEMWSKYGDDGTVSMLDGEWMPSPGVRAVRRRRLIVRLLWLVAAVLVVFLLGSCGGSTSTVSAEVEMGVREYADGVVMAVENVSGGKYVLVVRVKGGVSRVGFVDDGGSTPVVGDTLVLFREKGGAWRFQ